MDTSRTNAVQEEQKMTRRKRRSYTAEQRAAAVKLVLESGRSVAAVARDLELTQSALAGWVKQAQIDQGKVSASSLTTLEKEELASMKREVKRLREENAFLKKASAFFAKESQ